VKGAIGNHVNPLMAACTWNLKQWLLAIFWLFLSPDKMAITDKK
jgi:IS5 family transposase